MDGQHCHTFQCLAQHCKHKTRSIQRYLDTGDAKSTGNLRKHTKRCWGDNVVALADKAKTAKDLWDITIEGSLKPQSITATFERNGKGTPTYACQQHTKTETWAEIIRWVSESMRPFEIVEDRGFHCLMKTVWPGSYIPSRTTVSRDTKHVFVNTWKRVAKILRVSTLVDSLIEMHADLLSEA